MSALTELGNRSQLSALLRGVADARGNRDGIPDNEGSPAGTLPRSAPAYLPLASLVRSTFEPGFDTRDERRAIEDFVLDRERAWGQQTTDLSPSTLGEFERFRAEKAIALTRFGRSPADVTEGFVRAAGTVGGQAVPTRQVFWQRWKPVGEPSGKVVVVSPGYLQTGRNSLEQISLLNRAGHDVVAMDHQWAGYSEGSKGGIDSAYGIARDVAAVTALAAEIARREYGDRRGQAVILGTSMGAGAGALLAATFNDAGLLRLEGRQMPKGVGAVLQAAYFSRTRSPLNDALFVASQVPGLKDLELPATGLPPLTTEPAAELKLAEHLVREGLRTRPQAFAASDDGLRALANLLDAGQLPQGRFYFLHADQDPLASFEAAGEFAKKLGDRARFVPLHSSNHILEESPRHQHQALAGIDWVCG